MVTHVCPICSQTHEVRVVRAALAYGRQLTCSPECESVRRKRMRQPPTDETVRSARPGEWALRSPDVSRQLHTWVMATVAADLVRTAAMAHELRRRKR
jgi:hypothetical protein